MIVELKCSNCGSNINREEDKIKTNNFCNQKCYYVWLKLNSPKFPSTKGKLNWKYKQNFNHTIVCEWCGENFEAGAYQIDHGRRFCSLKCKREWYAIVWSQSEEWKQSRREYAVSQLENGKNPNVNSAPQIIINNLLNSKNIQYKNEKAYKNFAVDNYLVENNLIIEIMGTYFHCDIRKYKVINYSNQVTRIRMDKIKHSYLLNNENIRALYLWEYDIYNNLGLCDGIISEYIKNKGVLLNYHSINYSIVNNVLCLNEDILTPYMDWDIGDLNKIISIETKKKRSRKQQDKWTQFNCGFCGKGKEELTSHYIKKERHFCCSECFNEYKKHNDWHRRKPLLAN